MIVPVKMLPVILRLFRWTPLFQLLLSGAAFFALMVLITIRLLYAYGLTASLSSSAPHLTAEFIEGETEDEAQLAALRQAFDHAGAISAFSPFLKGTRTLKIESPAYVIGQYKFEAPVEITGIDLKRFPFAIPLEQAESLKNEAYTTYTIKELAGQLLFSKQAVVVNEAMANLFAPRPGMAGEFIVWDRQSGQRLGAVRIVAVLRDLLDTPRMLAGLPLARQLLGKAGVHGIHARVSDLQTLETVRGALTREVGGFARVSSWRDGHHRQQKLFRVFEAVFWIITIAILVLAVVTGILGIYKVFVVKRRSLAILHLLGLSKSAFFAMLSGLNVCILAGGAGLAFAGFYLLSNSLHKQLVASFQAVLPIELPTLEWTPFLLWNGGLFLAYTLLSLSFLGVLLKAKPNLK